MKKGRKMSEEPLGTIADAEDIPESEEEITQSSAPIDPNEETN